MIRTGAIIQVISDPSIDDPLNNDIGIILGMSSMAAWPYKVLIEEKIYFLAENEMKVILP